MKRIAFFNSNLAWGGGEKWHLQMALSLKEKGYQVEIFTNPGSSLAQEAKKSGITTVEIGVGKLTFLNPLKRAQLRRRFLKSGFTHIVANLPSDIKFCAWSLKETPDIKLIYRRGMPRPLRDTAINRYAFSRVDLIVANSEEIKRSVSKNIPDLEAKTIVITNGVIPIEQAAKLPSSINLIGNLGRLVPQKGQEHLINIAEILKKRTFQFRLEIAGTGPYGEELAKLIRDKNLQDCVRLVGHMRADEFLKKLDLFVFPSYFEGSANSLIEAMNHGLPCVAFDISSNPEIIVDNLNGKLVEPFDENAFADSIQEVLIDKKLYNRLSEAAIHTVKNKFDYRDKIADFQRILD